MSALTGYNKVIVAATGCPNNRAEDVQGLMRLEHPTLGGLSLRKFRSEARICWAAVQFIDANPEK